MINRKTNVPFLANYSFDFGNLDFGGTELGEKIISIRT